MDKKTLPKTTIKEEGYINEKMKKKYEEIMRKKAARQGNKNKWV